MTDKVEIEKKYLIMKPAVEDMSGCEGFSYSDIVQIYLPADGGATHRIRSREYPDGRVEYTETTKVRIDKMSAYEDESEIDKETFDSLAENILEGTRPIEKRRYVFEYCGQIFEIDEYPEYENSCIMETELSSRKDTVTMPPFIKIIADVTGDKRYSNASLAKVFPEEIKI